ncbi:MAG: DEAD/DEAH box helicase family protein [Candidatus ainarchaeum sp.]|nr:DEAD/DEAH box helicase family protein [Candidatus ainarchaeum sp.]
MTPEIDDSEFLTRKKMIDPQLKEVGWKKEYIKEEINSVKSDFKKGIFKFKEKSVEKGVDRFIDYLLIDENNKPLAIIEAKKSSVDFMNGYSQAMAYREDIKKQTGYDIPVFLTNGAEWRFIDEDFIERNVSGPFSQEDLFRKKSLFEKSADSLKNIRINEGIVNRPRSKQIVLEILEWIDQGNKSALIQMATGTGKTRVAMAIIEALKKAHKIENVLFIADRTSLVNQAKGSKGFKGFFPDEPINDLRTIKKEYTGRLFCSTIQTLMEKNNKFRFESFSPAFFDLIIFDEAHRSYYDRGNLVMKYFDAIKIGLTATPRSEKEKDTYNLFGCPNNRPNAEYSYDEAISDGILVPYEAEIISTKVLSLGINGSELTKELKDALRKQEENPDEYQALPPQFERIFTDDKTNELIVSEFMQRCRRSIDGKPCKTIFFCASKNHAKSIKDVFARLFPKFNGEVRIITSDQSYAQTEIKNFTEKPSPRIALSVGMLDTGVDVPEVCNLVFVKPVYSQIRFWQMLGRGTRNEQACEHKDWLPFEGKKSFLILDFAFGGHSNIKFHELERKQKTSPKSIPTQIFENRIELLKKELNEEQKRIISEKILNDLKELDKDSFLVKPKNKLIEKISKNKFDLEKYITDLNNEIAPLMILSTSQSPYIASFILQVERLFAFILNNNYEKIDFIKKEVQEKIINILDKENLTIIKENKSNLTKVLQETFWTSLTFEDVEFLVNKIAPLMKYYTPYKNRFIRVNMDDMILNEEKINYNFKGDKKLNEFLENNDLAKKIKTGKGITSQELIELEKQLKALNPILTIESIQEYQKKDFIEFLLEQMKISHKENPKELIEKRFDEYIIKNHEYNSKQIEFLLLLKKIFSTKKYIELDDFTKMPLREKNPLSNFSIDELKEIVNTCNKIKVT